MIKLLILLSTISAAEPSENLTAAEIAKIDTLDKELSESVEMPEHKPIKFVDTWESKTDEQIDAEIKEMESQNDAQTIK